MKVKKSSKKVMHISPDLTSLPWTDPTHRHSTYLGQIPHQKFTVLKTLTPLFRIACFSPSFTTNSSRGANLMLLSWIIHFQTENEFLFPKYSLPVIIHQEHCLNILNWHTFQTEYRALTIWPDLRQSLSRCYPSLTDRNTCYLRFTRFCYRLPT